MEVSDCEKRAWMPGAGRVLMVPLERVPEPSLGLARPSPQPCIVTVRPLLPLGEGERDTPSGRCVCFVHMGSSFLSGGLSPGDLSNFGDLAMSEPQGALMATLHLPMASLTSPWPSRPTWRKEGLSPRPLSGRQLG